MAVIAQLSLEARRTEARQAAQEQAWTDGLGVRGVRTRIVGRADLGASWALEGVLDHIRRAVVIRWDGDGDWVVVQSRGDLPRSFCLSRPGKGRLGGVGAVAR
jgi:hypothetical protein